VFKQQILAGSLALFSLFADAAIVSMDLRAPGDGLISLDTVSHLEWLDVKETRTYSYNEIRVQFGVGGDFEGWRHATLQEVTALNAQFGFNVPEDFARAGDPTFRTAFYAFNALFGEPGRNNFYAVFGQPEDISSKGYMPTIVIQLSQSNVGGFATIDKEAFSPNFRTFQHLVRVSAVPVPAAAWLMGSSLVMLAGIAGRKKHLGASGI
jgi:hypothetical protein